MYGARSSGYANLHILRKDEAVVAKTDRAFMCSYATVNMSRISSSHRMSSQDAGEQRFTRSVGTVELGFALPTHPR
ncbi:hypothetical protein DL767_005801 [Monosporascus sp. MG133]|nr:hypothetical protein DL767_005801 [Monosporascus sp. MG133]